MKRSVKTHTGLLLTKVTKLCIGYNSQNDRYGLLVSDLWEDSGFHCGECLQVQIDGEWVDTSMEMDWSTGRGVWYLTGTDIRGEDLEYTRARIQKEEW